MGDATGSGCKYDDNNKMTRGGAKNNIKMQM